MCFEAEGTQRMVQWQYVGEGRGGYSQVGRYDHVGDGKGHYDNYSVKEIRHTAPATGRGRVLLLAGFATVVALGACIYVSYPSLNLSSSMVTVAAQHGDDLELFNCNKASLMIPAKVEYCCQKHQVFCTTTLPSRDESRPPARDRGERRPPARDEPPPAAPVIEEQEPAVDETGGLFDCQDGLATWSRSWSVAKMVWCCQKTGAGCENADGDNAEYNCDWDSDGGFAQWAQDKNAWCCDHLGRGCGNIVS